jgi:hypothetical protein
MNDNTKNIEMMKHDEMKNAEIKNADDADSITSGIFNFQLDCGDNQTSFLPNFDNKTTSVARRQHTYNYLIIPVYRCFISTGFNENRGCVFYRYVVPCGTFTASGNSQFI